MAASPPKWITPFFYCAVLMALVAITLVVLWHDADQPDIGNHDVADITINLGGKPVREHCTTCHIDGARPDPKQLNQTTRSHPDITPHRIDQLGCTGCHLGEGMALDIEISHGLPGLEARKVLSGKDMQASCFRCHQPGPLPGAEKAWKGYQQFFAKACNTCHAINRAGQRGFYGPDLSRIGSILGLDQIQLAIREPRKEPVNSKMPRFPLSKSQSRQISYFLKSLTGDSFYETPMQMQSGMVEKVEIDLVPEGIELSDGESALYRQQCLSCHKFGQADGRIGPDLTYIGAQRDADYLTAFLDNPTRLIPGAAMPRIPMDASTEKILVQFLLTDAVGPVADHMQPAGQTQSPGHEMAPDLKMNPKSQGPSSMGAKQLYMQLCQRCHAAEGNGRGSIQPNLANFPRAFLNNAAFFRSVSDQRLQESLRNGIPGTSMPGYGKLLTQQQADQLLDLVFTAFINLDRQDKERVISLPERPYNPVSFSRSDELYVENCQRCHGAFGTGTGPESLEHQPRPRNLRNRPYFNNYPDERIFRAVHDGIPGTAMPAFRDHLDTRDLWGLVDKVKTFSRGQGSQ